MADDDDTNNNNNNNNNPSLPANYVSLLHLQQQWLQKKQKQQQEQEAAAKQKELEIQKPQEFATNEQNQQFQKQGNYVKNNINVEKLNVGSSKSSRILEKVDVGSVRNCDQESRQFQEDRKKGDYGKNSRNVEKLNVGSSKNGKNLEKCYVGSVRNCDQESRQFQEDQKKGDYGKNSRNGETLNVSSSKNGRNLEKCYVGSVRNCDQESRQFQEDQKKGDYGKNSRNGETLNVGSSKNGRNLEKCYVGSVRNCDQESRQFQEDQKKGDYGKHSRNGETLNVGGVQDSGKKQFPYPKQGGYGENRRNLEKLNLGSKNYSSIEKCNVGSVQNCDQGSRQLQEHQKQGNYGENGRNLEILNLGSKNNSNIEKCYVGSVRNCDRESRQFQEDQKQGNYGENNKNIEKLNNGSVKNKRTMEKLSLGRVQESDQHNRECKHDQGLEGYVKDNKNMEKMNLGSLRESDRNGYRKSVSYDRNNGKGVYKDKGKGKIGEVGEREFDCDLHRREESGDFGRCDGEFRRDFGGGGACFVVSMCSMVEVKEDEFVEVKKTDDGFRGGLTGNGSDLRAHYGVSENLGKGETMVETETCLERGKKVGDEAMKAGNRKQRSSRASRKNQGSLVENCGDSCNVTKGEGVGETGDVLELKENESISDMGVAIDVKNVEQRGRKGYRNTWNKMDVSKGMSRNGRGMAEESIGQLDLEKENGEEKGNEGNGDNIGDGESVAEKVVQLKEPNRKSVSLERRNVKGRVMERARGGYEIWTVKEVRKGANIIKNTAGDKSTINESVEEITVVESEIIAKADLYSNGSQRHYCDNMENIECREKTMEKMDNQKQKLFVEEPGDKGLLMEKEANRESDRVRDKNRGIWRKNVPYNRNLGFQGSRFGDKQRNRGLVWVKKEDTAGATNT